MTDSPSDPIANPPPSVLKDLDQRRRQYPGGGHWYEDDHGYAILDDTLPGLPNADAKAVARWLRRMHPELWDGATSAETKPSAETSSTFTPGGLTDLMLRTRNGDATADAEFARNFLKAPARW